MRSIPAGPSLYSPTCGAAGLSGPEAFFVTDVPPQATNTELVYDLQVVGGSQAMDAVLEVTNDCTSVTGDPVCSATGRPGSGEVVVIPNAAGRHFAVVDTENGMRGNSTFSLQPFVRTLVGGSNGPCDFAMRQARCVDDGAACFDMGNGQEQCAKMAPISISHSGDLASACQSPQVLKQDGIVVGALESSADVDVVQIEPDRDMAIRVIVDDGRGGCAVDSRIRLVTDACTSTTPEGTSDRGFGAFGGCPAYSSVGDVVLAKGSRHWLHILRSTDAPNVPDPRYRIVIDLDIQP